ncbi:MAG: tRNA uridine-5-carboxymethylaminomethyl(34) synthesis enzyme MnmG, partial [Candidatus Latescibacteria bacterium]|nr:tRNA uridine-5-carboxymethylaminomethyl(34) synthesis enzyme MnmG [Candidatus Latescibacterota bacterium]
MTDVLVVGGGHAGVEAACIAAKMGCSVAMMTMDSRAISRMSCNPAIGGTAKGHLVREIDALGGVMARLIDATGIQFNMLNRSRGPAVWSPRAQADRAAYGSAACDIVNQHPRIEIIEDTTHSIIAKDRHVQGVVGAGGAEYRSRSVIICAGTFMRGLMHSGETQTQGGRTGEQASVGLSASLKEIGLELGRFKTGTPPRVDGDTIDRSVMQRQDGDEPIPFFSFDPPDRVLEQVPCWLTQTTPATHDILRDNLHLSPLFSGQIEGIGPRYCPSVEDKIVRFADKDSHQVFIEPEGLGTNEVYVNGFSTSMPPQVQLDALHTIPGMESAVMTRAGYAVEYDYVNPIQLSSRLEVLGLEGLYLAGQVCGTSGYEEAAAQGLMAGINAARTCQELGGVVIGRDQAYIGVMIDDLVTKGVDEPYRLFTSRAEHRLLLRQDSADLRLCDVAHSVGTIDSTTYRRRRAKNDEIDRVSEFLNRSNVTPEKANPILLSRSTTPIEEPRRAAQLLRRPEIRLA